MSRPAITPAARGRNGDDGFVVVAVLWILTALAALVLTYLAFVTTTAFSVRAATNRVEVQAALAGGIELAAFQLLAVNEEQRPSSGSFATSIGTARVAISFRTEAARIDLNAAPRELLAGLAAGFGARPVQAAEFADRVISWRAPAQSTDDDPENALYRAAGLPYLPRHAPFAQTDELWLVQGVPAPLTEQMLPYLTVFSNLNTVNVLEAAPQVLAALPGMTPANLKALLTIRADPRIDRAVVLQQAGQSAGALITNAYRVEAAAIFDGDRSFGAEVVILLLENGDTPYRVLSWRERVDAAEPQRSRLR